MVSILAGDAPELPSALAGISVVLPSAYTAYVSTGQAFSYDVSPFSTLHALYWLELLLCGSDSGSTDDKAISDEDVSIFCGGDGQNSVGMCLAHPPSYGWHPVGFADCEFPQPIYLLQFSKMVVILQFKDDQDSGSN